MAITRAALAVWMGLAAWGSGPRRLWDAVLTVDGREVAFRFELEGEGRSCRGAFLDGERRIWSTSGVCEKGGVALRWSYFDSGLKASMEGGRLRGVYSRRTRVGVVRREFAAVPFQSRTEAEGERTADFGGVWRIQTDAERGARVMDGRFRQSGGEVTGTIQRVDGDFGTLSGRARGNGLRLSHFDGIRATLIEGQMTAGGTIEGTMDGKTRFTAARLEQAKAMGIPEPPDPTKWVSVKDPTAVFAFRFQDLEGKWVSLADERFRGKPVIATIMGSWCPNCHDEADFLMELYRKYAGQGLEVVALGFEYTGEVERDRETLGAFGKLHRVTYPMLLAGTTEDGEVLRKLPQLANFAGYPATIYLGRDHRVRSVHAGFAGPANAEEHGRLKGEVEELVKAMLAER